MKYNNLLSIILFLLTISIASAQQDVYSENYYNGMDFYNKGDFKTALPYFEKLIELNPDRNVFYNAACVASLSNNLTKGFSYLELSIKNGFADTTHLREDTDLNNLKSDTRWVNVSHWLIETKSNLIKEIAKIKSTCPASNLIPYEQNGKWGYFNKKTKQKVTNAIFHSASFIGKSGSVDFGDYQLYFTCSGNVTKTHVWIGGIRGAQGYYSPTYVSSNDVSKGFIVENGAITTYASVYNSFVGFQVFSNRNFAIVDKGNSYNLIDSTGEVRYDLTNYPFLTFYNFGSDSKYFPKDDNDVNGTFLIFLKDSTGQIAYVTNTFKKRILPEASDYKYPNGNGFDKEYLIATRKFIYIQTSNKWGIWNCETKDWQIKPEYDEIYSTDRTFDGDYEINYSSGKTIDIYFKVKQNNQNFYIDLKNNKYIVK